MWSILGFVVVAAFLWLASTWIKSAQRKSNIAWQYQRADALFSAAERSFLSVLDESVGSEYRVFGKVQLADIALVKSGLSGSALRVALGRISGKHVDFVVCRAHDLAIVCAVELSDGPQAAQHAPAPDQVLNNVCRAIRLPLLQLVAKRSRDPQDVRSQFLAAITPVRAGAARDGV